MSRDLDPTQLGMLVERVENGWVVRTGVGWRGDGAAHSAHVARTPKELSALLETWAQQQCDLPPVTVNLDEARPLRPGGRIGP